MLLSTIRNFEIPTRPRPQADVTYLGEHRNKYDGTVSGMYKISLVPTQKLILSQAIHTSESGRFSQGPLNDRTFLSSPLQPQLVALSESNITVVKLEIFGCIQRQNHSEITRWKQIAQVDLRKKKGRREERRCSEKDFEMNAEDPKSTSVKIYGFSSEFQYQIVVRGVDPHGKRSLFSQPVFIVPPKQSGEFDVKHSSA